VGKRGPPLKVLFLTHEPLTDVIAGPSIRVWELAHLLGRAGHTVTIGTPNQHPRQSPIVEVRSFSGGAMSELVRSHDITIGFGYVLREYPAIRRLAHYLVMDVYGPFLLENLHLYGELGMSDRLAIHQRGVDVVLEQLQAADFLICASERQRDFWLGALSVANRINPYTSEADPSLRALIDVVPFGLPAEPPRPSRSGIKGLVPGIAETDIVVLWWGGIWNWFDPVTAIEAMASLGSDVPGLKLYFTGVDHPNPRNPKMAMSRMARERAQDRRLLNRTVFFNEGWIPYDQRMNYLCDADLAISLHREHAETRLSFRTRFLDCLWASLPIVATRGDVLCDAAVAAGAGVDVPEGDVPAVAGALRELALAPERRAEMRRRAAALAARYTWQEVARPLLAYCERPHRAADAGHDDLQFPRVKPPSSLQLAVAAYRLQGVPGVTRRAGRLLRRRAGKLRGGLFDGARLLRRAIEVWRTAGMRGVARKAAMRLRRPGPM